MWLKAKAVEEEMKRVGQIQDIFWEQNYQCLRNVSHRAGERG